MTLDVHIDRLTLNGPAVDREALQTDVACELGRLQAGVPAADTLAGRIARAVQAGLAGGPR